MRRASPEGDLSGGLGGIHELNDAVGVGGNGLPGMVIKGGSGYLRLGCLQIDVGAERIGSLIGNKGASNDFHITFIAAVNGSAALG